MSALVALPSQLNQPSSWSRESLAEDTLSPLPSDQPPKMQPGYFPSPYRASNAAAFADINRALDKRSLRNSVMFGPQSNPVPLSPVRPGPTPLVSSPNVHGESQSIDSSHPDAKPAVRSKSLPATMWRVRVSEDGQPLTGPIRSSTYSDDKDAHAPATVKSSRKTKEAFVHGQRSSKKTRPTDCVIM